MSPTKILPIILLLTIATGKLTAQCRNPLPAVACTGTEALVIADETINSGTTKFYYGPTVTMNSLTLKGGTLIVCGNLTIDKFYMDSGRIIINPGARFVIGSGIGAGLILQGNCNISNYGTLEVLRNLSLDNGWATAATPNVVINATGAIFRMPNQYFVINNAHSWFVNKGYAQFWGLITDPQSSPGSVCLGSSTTHMAVLINKVANAYVVSGGVNACIYVHQFSQFFGVLTSSSNLFACLGASHTSDAGCVPHGCTPNAWGAAQVFTNCSNCAALNVLAVNFVSIEIASDNNSNILKWQLDANASGYFFYVERADDSRNFYTLDSVAGNTWRNFNYTDAAALPGINYYRIRCVNRNSGSSVFSKIISSKGSRRETVRIYPSPFVRDFYVELPQDEVLERIIVSDMAGKNIPVRYQQTGLQWKVMLLHNLPGQVLFVQVITNKGVQAAKIIKK